MSSQTARSGVSVDDRRSVGEQAARQTPVSLQAEGPAVVGRVDPVELLVEQNLKREQDLVPVRHGRMMVSPFTFYRGAAAVMAADLAGTATAGLEVQLCGYAHLSNFGGFGAPRPRPLNHRRSLFSAGPQIDIRLRRTTAGPRERTTTHAG
jgi:hypothetical protein